MTCRLGLRNDLPLHFCRLEKAFEDTTSPACWRRELCCLSFLCSFIFSTLCFVLCWGLKGNLDEQRSFARDQTARTAQSARGGASVSTRNGPLDGKRFSDQCPNDRVQREVSLSPPRFPFLIPTSFPIKRCQVLFIEANDTSKYLVQHNASEQDGLVHLR